MTLDGPLPPGTGYVEPPSPYAELAVQLGPAQPWGTARGRVPPEQAHHLITTFGIVADVIAGIAGTVLTLRIAARLTGPAYAELGLAFGAAVMIAIRRAVSRIGRRQSPPIRAGTEAARLRKHDEPRHRGASSLTDNGSGA